MEAWRAPLDEFTLRYLMARLVGDRETHLREAQEEQERQGGSDGEAEVHMIRAEECARIIEQIKKIIGLHSDPPPKGKPWSEA